MTADSIRTWASESYAGWRRRAFPKYGLPVPLLRHHPWLQVVARDLAGAYSDAAQNAIPRAQQVADRRHLLVNLHETVERLLRRHIAKLREAAQLTKVSQLSQTQPVQEEAFPLMAWQKLSLERRSARLARYEEVVRLR